MRFFLPLVFLVLAAAGCSTPESDPDASGEAAATTAPISHVVYACESGREIQASYPTDSTAIVEYDGQTLQMSIAVSGSGARYVGDELEWWTKGAGPASEGTLFRHNGDGTSGELVEECQQSE